MLYSPLFWLYLLATLAVAVLVQVRTSKAIGPVIRRKIPEAQMTARIVVWIVWWWVAAPFFLAIVVGLFWLLTWSTHWTVATIVAVVLAALLGYPLLRNRASKSVTRPTP